MVNSWEVDVRWEAPGLLELVRRLLNTADEPDPDPSDDRLIELARSQRAWRTHFPQTPLPGSGEVEELQALRSDLRQAIDDPSITATTVQTWLSKFRVVAGIADSETGPTPTFESASPGACGAFLAYVLTSIDVGSWSRLRSCPDCRLVFFDRSRNRSRRWCGMYAGENGRSCGSIAKVQRWRERHSGRR